MKNTLFLQKYENLVSKDVILEEHKSKRNITYYSSKRLIATCTIRALVDKIKGEGIDVSLGTVHSLKPFFVTYPTERELSLCLCKLCLNVSLLHDTLKKRAKQDGDVPYTTATDFFMHDSTCAKTVNGYYSWSCVTGNCKKCKNVKPVNFKCHASADETTLSQFEITKEVFKKKDENGKIEEKTASKTMRVTIKTLYADVYSKLVQNKLLYLKHYYQVYNDRYHWKFILDFKDHGEIFHYDFSENIVQMFKAEPQSSHFNKNQFSLHCAVRHGVDDNVTYEYHLSDDRKHDSAIVSLVTECLLDQEIPSVIQIKSDNCAVQYKCADAFGRWQQLSAAMNRTIILYYGTPGHGKGLVDSMSSFGVKNPLRRAVYSDNFMFNSAQDIVNFLLSKFKNDDTKNYYHIDIKPAEEKSEDKSCLKIKGCTYDLFPLRWFSSDKGKPLLLLYLFKW